MRTCVRALPFPPACMRSVSPSISVVPSISRGAPYNSVHTKRASCPVDDCDDSGAFSRASAGRRLRQWERADAPERVQSAAPPVGRPVHIGLDKVEDAGQVGVNVVHVEPVREPSKALHALQEGVGGMGSQGSQDTECRAGCKLRRPTYGWDALRGRTAPVAVGGQRRPRAAAEPAVDVRIVLACRRRS